MGVPYRMSQLVEQDCNSPSTLSIIAVAKCSNWLCGVIQISHYYVWYATLTYNIAQVVNAKGDNYLRERSKWQMPPSSANRSQEKTWVSCTLLSVRTNISQLNWANWIHCAFLNLAHFVLKCECGFLHLVLNKWGRTQRQLMKSIWDSSITDFYTWVNKCCRPIYSVPSETSRTSCCLSPLCQQQLVLPEQHTTTKPSVDFYRAEDRNSTCSVVGSHPFWHVYSFQTDFYWLDG